MGRWPMPHIKSDPAPPYSTELQRRALSSSSCLPSLLRLSSAQITYLRLLSLSYSSFLAEGVTASTSIPPFILVSDSIPLSISLSQFDLLLEIKFLEKQIFVCKREDQC